MARLTKRQWQVLESLFNGNKLSMAPEATMFLMRHNGFFQPHGRSTADSLVRHGLISNSELAPQVYTLTPLGHATVMKRRNRA